MWIGLRKVKTVIFDFQMTFAPAYHFITETAGQSSEEFSNLLRHARPDYARFQLW
jgi:hypothetical protein